MSHAQATPVLVLGGGLSALGVIRRLGAAGVRSYVLTHAGDFVRRSRWFRPPPSPAATDPGESVPELAAWLDGLPLERAVLLPCSDAWALRVARLDPRTAARFPSSQALPAVLETLLDKERFAVAVGAAGVPHPRTVIVHGPGDLRSLPDAAFAGSFLKPRDSQQFFARFGVKAFRVAGRDDALQRLDSIAAAGLAVIFQEYVPGAASDHLFVDGFVDRGGECRGVFARRRLRMYPRDFGNSSFMVSVSPGDAAEAVAAVQRLLNRIGYRGIFSAEFKRDARDGSFRILEVNARAWWYVEFAARCGVDVCAMAYRDALGLPVETARGYRVGRKLVYPYYDYHACRDLVRDGGMTVWAWARSWLGAEQPIFRWSDPVPALAETARGLGRALRGPAARRA